MTKDILQDIVKYTDLGAIETVKITGSPDETKIAAVASDRTMIMTGVTVAPVADFTGVFGMPNLDNLKTILSFDEYDANANITVNRTEDSPVSIKFQTESGDFVNEYRLMSKTLVEERVKNVTFKGAAWHVDFQPTVAGIMRLKKQAQAHNKCETFSVKTEGTDLKIYLGSPSTHSGNFVFCSPVSGRLTKSFYWPVKRFLSIMDLAGDKHIYISDQGVIRVTVDSGLSKYEYLLPAMTSTANSGE